MGFPSVGFPIAMASGAGSAALDLGGKGWLYIKLLVPTMTSTTALDVYTSVDGTTYYQMRNLATTSTVQVATFTVPATMGANGGVMPLNMSTRYIKLVAADSAPTAATTFYAICND